MRDSWPWVQDRLGGLELGGMDKRRVEGIADETRRRGDACPCFSSVAPARANAASSIHWTFDSPIPRRLSMPPTRQCCLAPRGHAVKSYAIVHQ